MSTPDSESLEPEQTVTGDDNPQTPETAEDDTGPTQQEPESGTPRTGTIEDPPTE